MDNALDYESREMLAEKQESFGELFTDYDMEFVFDEPSLFESDLDPINLF